MSIHARKTKNGTRYDVHFRDLNAQQHSKTFRRRKDAAQFESEIHVRKAREELPEVFPKKRQIPFAKLALKWLNNHSKVYKSPSSHKRDEGVINNHLIPYFGLKDANRISTLVVDKYIRVRPSKPSEKTHRSVKNATLNRELEILRKIYNDALKWKDVRANPCNPIRKLRENLPQFDYLSETEIKRFLNETKSKDYALYASAIYTGMRLGELLNLKMNSVDLRRMMITVSIGSEFSGTTKSGKVRYVPIHKALRPHLAKTMKTPGEYVFPRKLGPAKRRRDIRKAYHAALRRAGIERHIRFHDLRHTFASHFVMKGGDLLALKEILGHSSLQMVQRYAHLAPGHLRKGIDRLDFSY